MSKGMLTSPIFRLSMIGGKRVEFTSDEDSINNDAWSEGSGHSDNRSMLEDANDNEVDEITQQEVFEEKLKETIDGLTQKSAKGRTICFNSVEKIFATKYIPDFVEDRKMTISDSVERGLKKGRADEQSTAARLSTLLCVQLGVFESAETICRDLKSTLIFIANDHTASANARAEVSLLHNIGLVRKLMRFSLIDGKKIEQNCWSKIMKLSKTIIPQNSQYIIE